MFADLSACLPPGLTATALAAGDAGVLAAGDQTRLLRWQAGRLAEVPLQPAAHPNTVAVAAADIDGDGCEEWLLVGSPTRLLRLTPAGWEPLLSGRPGTAVAVLDRRGTGRYAFAVAGGSLRLIEVDAAGRPHDAAPALGLTGPAGTGLWAGPLVSDRPDLFQLAADGWHRLFANGSDEDAADIASRYDLVDPDSHGRAVAALDADGDGRLDLLLGNEHAPNRLLVRQVDGTFRDRATPALAMPGAVVGVFAADFDNCGYEELFLHLDGEPNRLFRHTPDGWRLTDAGPATLPDGIAIGGCVTDLNGDGTLELLLAGDRLALFQVSNAHHWLRVQPLTRFGAPARGATVRLTAGGRTQVRVIDGGPNEPVAHFGLGAVERVESVAVQWPDGARATVAAPAVRQTHTLRHPDG